MVVAPVGRRPFGCVQHFMRLEFIDCPICGHPSHRVLYKGIAKIEERVWNVDEAYMPTASKGRLVNRVVRCTRCRFVFTNPREHREDILRQYHGYVDRRYIQEEASRRLNARRLLGFVSQFAGPPGSWLDIGCSAGFLLDEARRAGWEPYGVEPSKWAAGYARDRLGLRVTTGEVEDLGQFPNNTFDVISMVVVLAHVIDPIKVMSEVRRVLKDKGVLYIQTPDFNCLMSRIMRSRWKTVKWQMLYFFTLESLGYLLNRAGLTIVADSKRGLGKGYSLKYILLHLVENREVRARIRRLFQLLGLGDRVVYLNLYEYISLIAVKDDGRSRA